RQHQNRHIHFRFRLLGPVDQWLQSHTSRCGMPCEQVSLRQCTLVLAYPLYITEGLGERQRALQMLLGLKVVTFSQVQYAQPQVRVGGCPGYTGPVQVPHKVQGMVSTLTCYFPVANIVILPRSAKDRKGNWL